MLSTKVDPVSRERLIVQEGRVLSCSLRYNAELDCYSFRFSNHRSVDWRGKVGKEYAEGKVIPEEIVRWLSDPHRKLPSYSSFDPCTLLFNSKGEVMAVRKGRLKYRGSHLLSQAVPRSHLVKEILYQTTFNEKYVPSALRRAKVPTHITCVKQVEKIDKANLLSCVKSLLNDHFRPDTYFRLSPLIPPLEMRRWGEEKLQGVEAMVRASPCTLSFGHSVAASLMESMLQRYEQLDGELNPLQREETEREIKLTEEVAKVLHSIPEVRGATALGDVAKIMKNGSDLEMAEFLAADAYPSFSVPLEEFGDDCVVVEAEEKKLVASLEEMGLVTSLGENQYSFTRTEKLNQMLATLLDNLIQQLPRTTPTEELIQSNAIRPEKRRRGEDGSTILNPVDHLKRAAHRGGLILVRTEGMEWLREYTELFQAWRYPGGDEFESGLSSHQQVLFVVPSYADQIVFFQHTGMDSMIAERPELGVEAHTDHLKDVLSVVRRYPGAVRHVVLIQAQQFDALTLLETLQMAHDVFCNLQSIILLGDDMLHPSPPRSRPLDTVHGLIPPCGQTFGFPFRDLIQRSAELGITLLRQRYYSQPPYNCVSAPAFADLQTALTELRQGVGVTGLRLQSVSQWSSDPICISALTSTLQLWRETGEDGCVPKEPQSDCGAGVVILLSTPNHWSREECWAAADLVSSELRRVHKRNPAVNTTRYCGERIYLEETGTIEIIELAYRFSYGRAFSLSTNTVIGVEAQQGGGANREQALIQLDNDPIPDHSKCDCCCGRIPTRDSGTLFPAFDAHRLRCGLVVPARFWRPTPTDLIVLLPVTAACGLESSGKSSTLTDIRTALSYSKKRCLLLEHSEQPLKPTGTLTRHSILSLLLQRVREKNTEWLE